MAKSKVRIVAVFITLLMAFSLAGCGGGSGGGPAPATSAPAAPAATAPAAPPAVTAPPPASPVTVTAPEKKALDEKNPICIGYATQMTTEGGVQTMWGMDLAINELNEAGGFDGRPFKMIYSNQGEASQQAYIDALMKLLDDYKKMSAVIADINTPYVLATIGNIESAGGVAYVSGASSRSNAESGSEWVFITRTVDIYSAANMCQYVMGEGADKIGILRMSDASGTSWTERFMEVLSESFNKTPVTVEVFDERTETNFTPYVLKAIAAGADTIVSKSGVVNEQVINAVYDNGFDGLRFDPDISSTQLKNCAEKIEGWRSMSDFNDKHGVNKPYLAWFNELFEKKFDLRSTRSAVQYHDIVLIIAEAIKAAGTATDKKAIRDGLYTIEDFEGLMTNYTYHEVGRTFPNYQFKLVVKDQQYQIEDLLYTYKLNKIYVYPAGKEPKNYDINRDKDRARQEGRL